ncbi:MAG: nucleotidyltransferase domain-containing protein [Oscillospiraceae bacterium]|jgi:predicted nucleotidyltransferase|nr:nucleotidyltransferase domain-containing protein [Oscillospiraceae bacterium]
MDTCVNEIANRYADLIKDRFHCKEIYLYGSYARGNANLNSDIDIAVIIDPIDNENYMKLFGKLFSFAVEIDDRIEPNLLIDYGDYDKYSFLSEVKETGLRIYF